MKVNTACSLLKTLSLAKFDPLHLKSISLRNLSTLIAMMQSTNTRKCNDLTILRLSGLHWPLKRSVFFKPIMSSIVMVVAEIRREKPSEVSFIQYNDMIETISPY